MKGLAAAGFSVRDRVAGPPVPSRPQQRPGSCPSSDPHDRHEASVVAGKHARSRRTSGGVPVGSGVYEHLFVSASGMCRSVTSPQESVSFVADTVRAIRDDLPMAASSPRFPVRALAPEAPRWEANPYKPDETLINGALGRLGSNSNPEIRRAVLAGLWPGRDQRTALRSCRSGLAARGPTGGRSASARSATRGRNIWPNTSHGRHRRTGSRAIQIPGLPPSSPGSSFRGTSGHGPRLRPARGPTTCPNPATGSGTAQSTTAPADTDCGCRRWSSTAFSTSFQSPSSPIEVCHRAVSDFDTRLLGSISTRSGSNPQDRRSAQRYGGGDAGVGRLGAPGGGPTMTLIWSRVGWEPGYRLRRRAKGFVARWVEACAERSS